MQGRAEYSSHSVHGPILKRELITRLANTKYIAVSEDCHENGTNHTEAGKTRSAERGDVGERRGIEVGEKEKIGPWNGLHLERCAKSEHFR